jgi:hypothetical protein
VDLVIAGNHGGGFWPWMGSGLTEQGLQQLWCLVCCDVFKDGGEFGLWL